MDSPPVEENTQTRTPREPNLLWTQRIEHEIDSWQRTGVFPFPELNLKSIQHLRGFSVIDLRLIYHLSSIYRDVRLADFIQSTLWVQQIPRYTSTEPFWLTLLLTVRLSFFDAAVGHDFVMSSILAFSATHMAWMTDSNETWNLAYFHRGVALKGMQEAISNFSESNSDAVLASSILLSWQASDW